MAIDWGEAEEKAGGQFKNYATSGLHKVKIVSVDHHEAGKNGSIAQDFKFAEDDMYQYPKVTHWLSFNNDNWRFVHNRSLMMLFGATKENAQKAVEMCESKGSKDAIVNAYQQAYERLLKKQPEVEIEVWMDGKYSRADFNDPVRMSRPGEQKNNSSSDDIMSAGEPITEDIDLPF